LLLAAGDPGVRCAPVWRSVRVPRATAAAS
jgi:hypothetical protein